MTKRMFKMSASVQKLKLTSNFFVSIQLRLWLDTKVIYALCIEKVKRKGKRMCHANALPKKIKKTNRTKPIQIVTKHIWHATNWMTNTLQHCQMAFNSWIQIGKISKGTSEIRFFFLDVNNLKPHTFTITSDYYCLLHLLVSKRDEDKKKCQHYFEMKIGNKILWSDSFSNA